MTGVQHHLTVGARPEPRIWLYAELGLYLRCRILKVCNFSRCLFPSLGMCLPHCHSLCLISPQGCLKDSPTQVPLPCRRTRRDAPACVCTLQLRPHNCNDRQKLQVPHCLPWAALPRVPGFRKARVSLPRKEVLQGWPHGHMAWRVTQGSTPGLVSIVKPGVWFSQGSGTSQVCGRKIRVFGAREF